MKTKEPRFQFHIPNLAKVTYTRLKEICEATQMTQWDVVTLGIHLVYNQWKAQNKELLLKTRTETKLLKPNLGPVKADAEHQRQTREENGEDFKL